MPDLSRPAPRFNPRAQPHKFKRTAVPLPQEEVERLFSLHLTNYRDLRAQAAACIIANTGLPVADLLRLTVADINQAQKMLFYGGLAYPLRTKPCILFAWLSERRYRPGVTQLLTSAYGTGYNNAGNLITEMSALLGKPLFTSLRAHFAAQILPGTEKP